MKRILLALALMGFTGMAQAETIKFCTGSEGGNYTFAAKEIVKRLPDNIKNNIEIVYTAGSLANLTGAINKTCDLLFAQGDVGSMFMIENPNARNNITPFKRVYDEYIHLMCPSAAGWSTMSDLKGTKARIIVGPNGGGSAETWRAIYGADDGYASLERLPNKVGVASISMVKDTNNTCMLWISGLNSGDMQSANAMSANTKDGSPALELLGVNDKSLNRLLGLDGAPLYSATSIEPKAPDVKTKNPGFYYNLIEDSWGSDAIDMRTVPAWLYSGEKVSKDDALLNALTKAVEDASPTIWNTVNPN